MTSIELKAGTESAPERLSIGKVPGYSLALLTTIAVFNTTDRQLISLLSTPMRKEFGLTDGQIGMLGLVYGVLFGLGALPLAALATRIGRKRVVVACMALFSFATAVSGLATGFVSALASRIGVALGESGTAAPSISMISDLYGRGRRTFALSIYSAASKPGGFIAFLAGGWLAQLYGWRSTFFIIGMPGVLISIYAWRALVDPAPTSDGSRVRDRLEKVSLMTSLGRVSKIPSFWYIVAGQAVWSAFTMGFVFWIPQYLDRSFGLTLGVIGTAMAFYTLLLGAIGIVGLGYVAQRLQVRDVRWVLGSLVLASVIAIPFVWLALTTASVWTIAWAIVPLVLIYSAHLGQTTAMAQSVVPASDRTISAGLMQFIHGVVGMGVGPFIPGYISGLLKPAYGQLSLRYALLGFTVFWLAAGVMFLLANRTLRRDIDSAILHDSMPEPVVSPALSSVQANGAVA